MDPEISRWDLIPENVKTSKRNNSMNLLIAKYFIGSFSFLHIKYLEVTIDTQLRKLE